MVLLMVLLAETGLAFIVLVAQQVVEFPARLHVRRGQKVKFPREAGGSSFSCFKGYQGSEDERS